MSLPDSARGDPPLRIRSSSSTGFFLALFNRQKTIKRPPKSMAPPTPTTTPITTFFWVLLRPLETVLWSPLVESPAVGVYTSTVVLVMVDATSDVPILVVITMVMILVEEVGFNVIVVFFGLVVAPAGVVVGSGV
jgi:hypothetical protein